jgi:hypothetical protein
MFELSKSELNDSRCQISTSRWGGTRFSDIAVVAIGGDATLKRFTRMGENVILLSENPSYDPIMLSEGQVSILGIAVGVVKNG